MFLSLISYHFKQLFSPTYSGKDLEPAIKVATKSAKKVTTVKFILTKAQFRRRNFHEPNLIQI